MTLTPCEPPNLPADAHWYALVGGETVESALAAFTAKHGEPVRAWTWGVYVMFEAKE